MASVFEQTLEHLKRRIRAMVALPLEALDGEELKHRLNEIGASADDNT